MRTLFFLSLLLQFSVLLSQPRYSKILDPFNLAQEGIWKIELSNDTLIVRGFSICDDPNKGCTVLGKYSITADSFYLLTRLEQVQLGYSLISDADNFYISSEERLFNNNISISAVNNNFEYLSTSELEIPNPRYYSYTIKSAIKYGNKLIVGAQALDSLDKVVLPTGDIRDKEKAVFFVLNENLDIDTILIIPPTPGWYIKTEDMAIGPDSILYISFYHYYQSGNTFQKHKVIYGFNHDFETIFTWDGPDFDQTNVRSSLAIAEDSTFYIRGHLKLTV